MIQSKPWVSRHAPRRIYPAIHRQAALCRAGASDANAIAALHAFKDLWSQLFPAEQARIIQLLLRRVTVATTGLEVDVRREGSAGVIREMVAPRGIEAGEVATCGWRTSRRRC